MAHGSDLGLITTQLSTNKLSLKLNKNCNCGLTAFPCIEISPVRDTVRFICSQIVIYYLHWKWPLATHSLLIYYSFESMLFHCNQTRFISGTFLFGCNQRSKYWYTLHQNYEKNMILIWDESTFKINYEDPGMRLFDDFVLCNHNVS